MAYELVGNEDEKKNFLYETEEFWKYRPSISFEMLKAELKNSPESSQFQILNQFCESVNYL